MNTTPENDRKATDTSDPTVVAAAKKEAAMAHMDKMGEDSPEWGDAQERLKQADERYARAPVTSLAGAADKARHLVRGAFEEGGLDQDEMNTLVAYLDGLVAADVPERLNPTEKRPIEILDPLLRELDQIEKLAGILYHMSGGEIAIDSGALSYLADRLFEHHKVTNRCLDEAWKRWVNPESMGGAS